jgi:acylpyruvate hydrolase
MRGEPLVYPSGEVRLHAPRADNARIACAGGNFADHAAAMAVKMRGRPYEGDAYQEIRNAGFWGFWKLGREIAGPDGELVYPERCTRLDYEGEIAIVLGKKGANLRPAQLSEYVWGITMLADWSIRAPREAPGGPLNFAFPKNFDTSCSIGPCIVVDETDPTNIDLETLVNGERRQRFNTRDMVFTLGECLEYLSRDFTLYPGDVISGGTAAGTAADSSELLADGCSAPERFLKPGDIVEMISPAIGSLRTRVIAKKRWIYFAKFGCRPDCWLGSFGAARNDDTCFEPTTRQPSFAGDEAESPVPHSAKISRKRDDCDIRLTPF